ncbi:MAG: hypothetical protein WCG76_00415 [Verrucomicrobiota bacterium]
MNRHRSAFRVNFQVIQMIAVVLVALAIPLALVALGISRYSPGSGAAAPETQGLRVALEQAAEKSWQSPEPVSDGRSVFILSTPASAAEERKAVEESVRKLGGVVLPVSTGRLGEERLLVQIPGSGGQVFESGCLRLFVESQHGHATGESRLYELVFPAP